MKFLLYEVIHILVLQLEMLFLILGVVIKLIIVLGYYTNGSIHHNNATTNGTGFPAPGTSGGYVLGLLFDADNKTMRYVYKGGYLKFITWQIL